MAIVRVCTGAASQSKSRMVKRRQTILFGRLFCVGVNAVLDFGHAFTVSKYSLHCRNGHSAGNRNDSDHEW